VVKRGEIWLANLPAPLGAEPGYRRPVLIISSDRFNSSNIRTVVVAVFTSNLRLARAPGNLFFAKEETGLDQDSILNVSQLLTVDKTFLEQRVSQLQFNLMQNVVVGLKLVLEL
jgi:mRNA interferase MazF